MGIGAVVVVKSDRRGTDEWVGEPIGVVVAGGPNEVYGYPGLSTPRYWMVAFSEFQYMADGRGPFEEASIPEWRLEALDPGSASA